MGGLKAKGGSEEYIQAKKEYDVLTTKGGMGPGTQSVFEGIKIRFKKLTFEQNMIMDEIKKNQFGILVAGGDLLESAIFSSTIATDESDLRNRVFKDNLKPDSDEVLTSSGNIANNFIKSSILISEGTEQIENLIDKIPGGRYYSGGNRSQPWRTGGSYDEDTGYVGSVGGLPSWLGGVSIVDPNLSKSVLKGQHGGMINEPIWGIGKSGQRYTFGEAGSELVTPMTGGKNTLGNITANITVNIEKVLQDVDLEQIKPIVERALLEVHSRRGII